MALKLRDRILVWSIAQLAMGGPTPIGERRCSGPAEQARVARKAVFEAPQREAAVGSAIEVVAGDQTIEHAGSERKLLYLLDEMLHGTNTAERRVAAEHP